MKKFLIIGVFALVAMLIVVACSDDDECPTCPAAIQQGVIRADVLLGGDNLMTQGYIFGREGLPPDVDSVHLDGDSVLYYELTQYSFTYGVIGYIDTTDFSSGDPVTLEVFSPGGRSIATVTLLDMDDDRPQIAEWAVESPYDTIPISSDIDIAWNDVANAEWYLVRWWYTYDSSGTDNQISDWTCQIDTTFSVPATETGFNGQYGFDIVAGTGPRPDGTTGNVTGGVFKGSVNSLSGESFAIFVGTSGGDSSPSVSRQTAGRPDLDIREFMASIRK